MKTYLEYELIGFIFGSIFGGCVVYMIMGAG